MNKREQKPAILVVLHEAGGAEIVAAYLKKRGKKFVAYIGGPAEGVFKRLCLPFKREPKNAKELAWIMRKHQDATFALLGTGGETTLEQAALKAARNAGIKTVAYIDSWKRYRERFGYPRAWRNNLPDEIWVGDKKAREIALRYFPRTIVQLVPNQYFAAARARFRALKKVSTYAPAVLFVAGIPDSESRRVLRGLLSLICRQKTSRRLRLRFHPASDRKNYSLDLRHYQNKVAIDISTEPDILNDLLHARVVIGPDTMALAVAAFVGIDTICVEPSSKHVVIPFPRMRRVATIKRFSRLF